MCCLNLQIDVQSGATCIEGAKDSGIRKAMDDDIDLINDRGFPIDISATSRVYGQMASMSMASSKGPTMRYTRRSSPFLPNC